MRNPLVATGDFAAFDVFVVLVDARQRGHVENVSDAVLRLLGRALDVGRRDLLGHAGALEEEREVKHGRRRRMPSACLSAGLGNHTRIPSLQMS